MPPRDATRWSPGSLTSEQEPTRLIQIAKIRTLCGRGRASAFVRPPPTLRTDRRKPWL
jgi:hypothetical protein